ncbi:MAG: 2,3-bisphosphoglycerate-independent phosphoglycerate mutase [Chloroflexota bacterium]|nr:2,3-bisphosphoglycerate-independent phosphoglycerate mutase [Chloroflexota bacterium]
MAESAGAAGGPVVLVVLDGWGLGRDEPGNAVLAAATPMMDRLWADYPRATLRCAGEDVGLPAGQMGNSEVGHLNLGAGFVVYQWLTRLDRAVADGEFAANPIFGAAIAHAQASGGTLHLLGLVSDGGVHSHVRHLEALLRLVKERGLARVAVHAFTDGRDTSPTSGLATVEAVERTLADLGVGRIATVAGRYFAMDRDKRWERTERAYQAIVLGDGERARSASEAIRRGYAAGTTDEFVPPTVVVGKGEAPTTIRPGDAVLFFNFRADRMRQLVRAMTDPAFDGFARGESVSGVYAATMARYEEGLPVHVAFPSQDVAHPVARAVSEAGLAQFHCAETEKYAHVTFFFNGGREEPFPGEERALVPSPKVATYDLEPEMSAAGVTDAVVAAIGSGRFGFVIVNFANGDMVGHTGVFAAAVRAIETVDACLGRVVEATLTVGGVALVTADHGNAEEMIDRATGRPLTAHTTNPVPLILVAPEGHPLRSVTLRQDGRLAAVAPTLMTLLGVPVPGAMSEAGLIAGPLRIGA